MDWLTWCEVRVMLLRLRLRIRAFAEPRHVQELAEYLQRCVQVDTGAALPYRRCLRLGRDRSLVLRPPEPGRPVDEVVLEELLAYLAKHGAAEFFQAEARRETEAQEHRKSRALASAWTARESWELRHMLLAWLLPAAQVRQLRTHEIAETAGVALHLVEERRRRLPRPLFIDRPPHWSAWHQYTVRQRDSPLGRIVRVVPRSGIGPCFEMRAAPSEGDGPRLNTLYEVNADLWALTAEEFQNRHARAESGPELPGELSLGELQEWAFGDREDE